jgi:hypothetical protein
MFVVSRPEARPEARKAGVVLMGAPVGRLTPTVDHPKSCNFEALAGTGDDSRNDEAP